ncbi:DUF6233 domain-containing protein [Streptomyces sp. NPDC088360]|uniref:DUF6233 domain-containing protein n=1 Tax=Streptomyces sp. NPDC088360 TaxID=3154515 RepID=UPI00344B7743
MTAQPPPVDVRLPDGQSVKGRLHARQQTLSGWRMWVGLPMWQNVGVEGEGIEAAEYRVWLAAEQAGPIGGVTYDDVPTYRLPSDEPPDTRWAWTVQRLQDHAGRVTRTVVHLYDCESSPGGASELNLDEALDALERPGAQACKKCGAAASLTPLLGRAGPPDRPVA